MFIKYLPSYSLELNVIDIPWRFIKYVWLPFSAYLNFVALKAALENILEYWRKIPNDFWLGINLQHHATNKSHLALIENTASDAASI